MIGSEQIRLGRAALHWSLADLAERSGVSVSTIRRAETFDGVLKCTKPNLIALQTTLEQAGVEFIGTPEDRPGIRIS